jgi:hypothetical protein
MDRSVFRHDQLSIHIEWIDEATLDGLARLHRVMTEDLDLEARPCR